MKIKWKDMPILDKIITVISLLTSSSVLVLGVLQILNVWDKAINVAVPLMGVTMLCQAYTMWNKSRKVAYISIGAAAFIFICAILVFFLT